MDIFNQEWPHNQKLPPQRTLPMDQPGMTFEQLFGCCENLWDSEEEFEQFLATIEATRKEKG